VCLRRSTSPTWRKAYQRMLFHVTQNISDGNRFSSLKAKDILRITTTPVFRPTSVALYQTLSRPRKRVSRETLKIFLPPNLPFHPTPSPKPAQTLDFIDYRGACPQSAPAKPSPNNSPQKISSPAPTSPARAHPRARAADVGVVIFQEARRTVRGLQ